MPAAQNKNGTMFVFVLANAMKKKIEDRGQTCVFRECGVFDEGRAHFVNQENTPTVQKMKLAASNAADLVLDNEPYLDNGEIEIFGQDVAREGDPRDIILKRKGSEGTCEHEVGVVSRWNGMTSKSFRISPEGMTNEWFGHANSPQWQENTKDVWDVVKKNAGQPWASLDDKDELVYRPLCDAVAKEFSYMAGRHEDALFKFVQNVMGRNDYWEVIAQPSSKSVMVRGISPHGYLGMSQDMKMNPDAGLFPTKIEKMGQVEGSRNTLSIIMNNGWEFTLRIHNGDVIIRSSLKTDIKFVGCPKMKFEHTWNTSYTGTRSKNVRSGNKP